MLPVPATVSLALRDGEADTDALILAVIVDAALTLLDREAELDAVCVDDELVVTVGDMLELSVDEIVDVILRVTEPLALDE